VRLFNRVYSFNDIDGGGVLDMEELKPVLKIFDENLAKDERILVDMFMLVDESGEGKVDFSEFLMLMAKLNRIHQVREFVLSLCGVAVAVCFPLLPPSSPLPTHPTPLTTGARARRVRVPRVHRPDARRGGGRGGGGGVGHAAERGLAAAAPAAARRVVPALGRDPRAGGGGPGGPPGR